MTIEANYTTKGLLETKAKVKELNCPVAILVGGNYTTKEELEKAHLDEETNYSIFVIEIEDKDNVKVLNHAINTVVKPTRATIPNRVEIEKYTEASEFSDEQVELIKAECQAWYIYNPGYDFFCLGYKGFMMEPSEEMSEHLPILTLAKEDRLIKDKGLELTDEQKERLIEMYPGAKDTICDLQHSYRVYLNDENLGLKVLEVKGLSTLPLPESIVVSEIGSSVEMLLTLDFAEMEEADSDNWTSSTGDHIFIKKIDEPLTLEDRVTGFYIATKAGLVSNQSGKILTTTPETYKDFYQLKVS